MDTAPPPCPGQRNRWNAGDILSFFFLLLLAAAFLTSGIGKLISFYTFTSQILDAGVPNQLLAAWLGIFIISTELLLAVCLLAGFRLRAFTYPAVLILLGLFTFHLVLVISGYGDKGDCGCFGEIYAMKPSAGILKNMAMAGITALLWHFHPGRTRHRRKPPVAFYTIAGTVFLLPCLWLLLQRPGEGEVIHRDLGLELLYDRPDPPPVQLRQGKYLLAFLSPGCSHCRKAAFSLQALYKQYPRIPLYFILHSTSENPLLDDFFTETRSRHVPHFLVPDTESFVHMAGQHVPAIYQVSDGVALRKLYAYQLDPALLTRWLETPLR